MAVPKFYEFMLPILELFSDDKIHSLEECIQISIEKFGLSSEDLNEMVKGGKQTKVANRINWSITYLKKALLIETIEKRKFKITQRGKELLSTNPKIINSKLLKQYDEFIKFITPKENKDIFNEEKEELTPEEEVANICKTLNTELASEILDTILKISPYAFERLVIDLLEAMGYGIGKVTKKSNDEGIDGIIDQDKLGLDKIYVQAKRWENVVGRPKLNEFVGALSVKNSSKGIFITTSDFTEGAKEYINNTKLPIKLINGIELANYMIEYNIGVQNKYSYNIKKIDNDYFESL